MIEIVSLDFVQKLTDGHICIITLLIFGTHQNICNENFQCLDVKNSLIDQLVKDILNKTVYNINKHNIKGYLKTIGHLHDCKSEKLMK